MPHPHRDDPQPVWDVLCLGETLISYEQRKDGFYAKDIGGDAANVALCVARMGGQAALASALGADSGAAEAQELWAAAGVDAGLVRQSKTTSTGHVIIDLGGQDDRFAHVRAGTAAPRLRPGVLSAQDIAKARVLHISGITLGLSASARLAAEIAADQAKAAGVLLSFDPVFQPCQWDEDEAVSVLLAMVAKADVFFPDAADAKRLFDADDPATALDRMLAHGPQVVVLRLRDGIWVATRSGRSFILADQQDHAHPLAVRDAFVGTFLSGLTAGDELVATGARAAQAASLAGAHRGEAGAFPGLEDLLVHPATAISPSAARVQPMRAGP
jgi:2-dehydro-3-deoxygluconokinase